MTATALLPRKLRPALPIHAVLPDAGPVALRPLRHGESDPLHAVFDGLSPESRRGRYLMSVPSLSTPAVRVLTDVDGHRHIAWLASVAGRPVGIARCIRVSPDTAEIAYEVVDRHQGRGIGAALVDAVTTAARSRGVARLEATVHPGNRASIALLHRIGLSLRLSDGLLEGTGALRLLERPRVDRRAVAAAARAAARTAPRKEACAAPALVAQ
jgi:GNAT superfamily N-acetyltransferase